MLGIIYKYISPSNKVYIGQTINEKCRRRCFLNINSVYAGLKIDNARKKYGPENFLYFVLETVDIDDVEKLAIKLSELEEFYINKYDSINLGYNISTGGANFKYYKNEDSKKRISEAVTKFKVIQYDLEGKFILIWDSCKEVERNLNIKADTIRKCCTFKNRRASCYIWRYLTDTIVYQIEGFSEKLIDNILKSKESANSVGKQTFKKVIQYSLDGKFIAIHDSLISAANMCNTTNHQISAVCSGKIKTTGGFIWRYYTEGHALDLHLSEEEILRDLVKCAKIGQYSLDDKLILIFNSVKEAALSTRHDQENISKACKLLIPYYNYYWRYEYVH